MILRAMIREAVTLRHQLGISVIGVVRSACEAPPQIGGRRISNTARPCARRRALPGNRAPVGVAGAAEDRLKIDVEQIVDSTHPTIESTRPPKRTSSPTAERNNGRSSAVPPAGFEPALPPPEAGRFRDRGRLLASYLRFLFASCVSGGLPRPVVRSTRHPTTSVLIGRFRDPRAQRSSVVLKVSQRWQLAATHQAAIQESLIGRGGPRSRAWAWISPQTVAAWKLHGRTTTRAKKAIRPARRRGSASCCPTSRRKGVGQLPLEDR
jgi:hypothetical protein